MENPIKTDDLGVPLFLETPKSLKFTPSTCEAKWIVGTMAKARWGWVVCQVRLVDVGHLSNEERAPFCCLGYIGDEILPSYVVIIVSDYKDPY